MTRRSAPARSIGRRRAMLVAATAGLLALALSVLAQTPATGRRAGASIPPERRFPRQSWPMLDVTAAGRRFVAVTFDGHVHTARSHDATHPPRDVVALAERVDLDAFMMTDHGTSSGAPEVADYAGPSTPVVGAEMGGQFGHALTWSFIVTAADRREHMHDMPALSSAVHRDGGLVVLAHPGWFIEGNFVNPRYYMQYDAIRRGGLGEGIDGIEVWNATYPARTESLIDEWLSLLDRQVYVPITCGTDFHRFGQVELGSPRNVVLCPADGTATTAEGKRRCLLEGARAGRHFLTDGPVIDLQIEGRVFGEIVQPTSGASLTVYVRAIAWQPAELRVRFGHTDVRTFGLEPGVVREERIHFRADGDTYVFAEVVRPQRVENRPTIALITNPIRVDVPPLVDDWRGPRTVAPDRIPREWTRNAPQP